MDSWVLEKRKEFDELVNADRTVRESYVLVKIRRGTSALQNLNAELGTAAEIRTH